MTEKRFFKALFKTMLFFAFLHMTTLIVLFVLSFKLSLLNVFSITGLNEFFPGIDQGVFSFIISAIIAATVYLGFYRKSKKGS